MVQQDDMAALLAADGVAVLPHVFQHTYIIGVSAGAANALSYISGQPGRSREIIEHYVGNPDYVSTRNLLTKHTMFDFDYIFGTVPEKHIFFDWDKFHEQDTRFLTGAMNCADGKTIWFEKDTLKAPFMASRASCSVPLITKIQHYMGYDLLDGGISDPIPIEKSLALNIVNFCFTAKKKMN